MTLLASTVLLIGGRLHAQPPTATNTVAVIDFESPGIAAPTDDWAFGLADMMAVELQQRDVALFERQQIRLVLGERRISAASLTRLQDSSAFQIPGLSYLVTGTIRPLTNQRFQLEVSLVEARTGRNAATFTGNGQYSKELPQTVASLAEQISRRLRSTAGGPTNTAPVAIHSSFRTPEVASLLYKGIAYCQAGQPEAGLTWFFDAEKAVPNFLPARVWEMRAFEMLGLADFAAIARERLRESPNGRGVLNRLNESHFFNHAVISVAVIPAPRLAASGPGLGPQLKNLLAQQTNFLVADPGNIHALAAEMDLQLTDQGARDLELTSMLWSSMDALVLVSEDPARPGEVTAQVRDGLSGELLFSETANADDSRLEGLARRLAEKINSTRAASGSDSKPPSRQGAAIKPAPVNNTDRNEFTGLLRYLAENPKDRLGWMRLALFFPWMSDWRYPCACFDRVASATDLSEPDATQWISRAIWHKRAYEGTSRGGGDLPSMATEAATLFTHFPESPEAQYARSAWALELVDQKKYAEAAPIFLKLIADLPGAAGQVKIGPDYWANLYFFTAVCTHETGNDARARQFLAQADELLRKNPNMVIYDGNTFQLGVESGVWVNHFPVNHPLFGKERNLRQAVAEWQQRLNPVTQTAGQEAATLDGLESLLTSARQSFGSAQSAQLLDFLKRLADYKQAHPEQFNGRITDQDQREPWRQIRLYGSTSAGNYTLTGKLMLEAPGVAQQLWSETTDPVRREAVRAAAHALAADLAPHIAAPFYKATGEYDLALQQIEAALSHPTPYPDTVQGRQYLASKLQHDPMELRLEKIHLLQALGRQREAAEYATAQIPAVDEPPHPEPLDSKSPSTGSYMTDDKIKIFACRDAADAWISAGQPDKACRIFADYARACGPESKMDAHSATVRIYWADYDIQGGNLTEAAEILRGVARQSEGKGWGAYLHSGFADAYDASLARLAKLRGSAESQPISRDWERPPAPTEVAPGSIPPALQSDLDELLRGTRTGPDQRTFTKAPFTAFANKYGHGALPAILQAAARNGFNAQMLVNYGVLQQITTPADAPQVLQAFKVVPQLAPAAFQLDAADAAQILRERFGIYARGGNLPPGLLQVVEQYRLKDQYHVLIEFFAARDPDGNGVPTATALDRILKGDPDAECLALFRQALASVIEKQLLSSYRYGLGSLGEIALRNGVPDGIEAVLHSDGVTATNCPPSLRKFIALPADDAAARAAVDAGLGRWQWDENSEKFILALVPPKNQEGALNEKPRNQLAR